MMPIHRSGNCGCHHSLKGWDSVADVVYTKPTFFTRTAVEHPMRSISHILGRRPLVWFFVVAYSFSWLSYAPGIIARAQNGPVPGAVLILSVVGNFGPLVAALVLTYLVGGRTALIELAARLRRWRVSWPWYVIALSWEAVHLLVMSGLILLVTGHSPDFPDGYPITAAPIVFAVIFITAGLAEEVGWRGFALPRLQSRWSPLAASLTLGLVWALWHLPGTFLPNTSHTGRSPAEWLWYIVGTIAFTVVITWVFNGTKGSVLLPMLLHAASNTTQAYLPSDVVLAGVNVDVAVSLIMAGAVVVAAKMWRKNAPLEATANPSPAAAAMPSSGRSCAKRSERCRQRRPPPGTAPDAADSNS